MIKRQQDEEFDLIILGGGSVGAGVARDASIRGLKVALVEKEDIASGTSSQSTKLLHGGLRYLKNFEFGLVREAALERKTNLEIAPHLGYIDDFLVPMYSWSEDRPIMLRLGLWVYDLLSFPKNIGWHNWLNKKQMEAKEPLLENETLKGGGQYQDVQTNDSRLTLANVQSALLYGAVITNYTKATSWEQTDNGAIVEVKDEETGEEYQIRGKLIINATGPWSEITASLGKNFNGEARIRPTWGAHLLLKKKSAGHPLLIVNKDGRAVFLIPHEDHDMAGTTDIDYHGDPDKIAPTEYDRDYILDAVNNLFPTAMYTKEDIVASFSGLRPLVFQKGVKEGKVSRNHEIFVDESGVITVAGGKLTTYRVIAKDVVDEAIKMLGLPKREYKCTTDKIPLYGGDIGGLDAWSDYFDTTTHDLMENYGLDEKTARKMVRYYGSDIPRFREILDEYGAMKFKEHRPWLEAQVIYACRYELIRTPVDFLRRRTWIMLEEGNGADILDKVVELMSGELHWDESTAVEMKKRTLGYIDNYIKIQPTEKVLGKEQSEELPEIGNYD